MNGAVTVMPIMQNKKAARKLAKRLGDEAFQKCVYEAIVQALTPKIANPMFYKTVMPHVLLTDELLWEYMTRMVLDEHELTASDALRTSADGKLIVVSASKHRKMRAAHQSLEAQEAWDFTQNTAKPPMSRAVRTDRLIESLIMAGLDPFVWALVSLVTDEKGVVTGLQVTLTRTRTLIKSSLDKARQLVVLHQCVALVS